MREIKFRFWDGTTGNMVMCYLNRNGNFEYGSGFELSFSQAIKEANTNEGYDKPKALMQYTGLKDKNGKEIYEGDIVECVEKEMFNKRKNHVKFISPVFWDELSWTLKESESCDTALAVYQNDSKSKRPITTIKVIGNIYENPELLK